MLMELRQLEYLLAVAEEGSFTRASAKLLVAQPGVSAQVRQLERELGHELLDRQARTVRLTEVGAAVLPYARAALEAVAGARLAVDELAGLIRGRVAVGMVIACSSLDVTEVLAGFNRLHPAVEISLSEANSDQLLQAVQSGELDLAFAAFAGPPPTGMETEIITDEPLFAAVSCDHPLAAKGTTSTSGLRDQALISLPRGTGLRTALENACAAAGFRPPVSLEASDPRMVAELASRGLGVAILPESLVSSETARLHAITITGPQPRASLALAWRQEAPTGPAGRALIDYARTAVATARTDAPAA
jgi:DNA-binding transcriptional LysR family regulator